MSIRSIMVVVSGSSNRVDPTLDAGFMLAHALEARVDVMFLQPDPTEEVPGRWRERSPEKEEKERERISRRLDEMTRGARRHFDILAKRTKTPVVTADCPCDRASASWNPLTENDDIWLARQARLSDLVVVKRPRRAIERTIVDIVLRGAARPMLVVPPEGMPAPPRHVAVAWNGSAESTHALIGAMPFIERAEQVTIITAETERTQASAAGELNAYLTCRGIKTSMRVFRRNLNVSVGSALLQVCADVGAEMMVLGASAHSRLHDRLLGGVTRDTLSEATVPLMMAR